VQEWRARQPLSLWYVETARQQAGAERTGRGGRQQRRLVVQKEQRTLWILEHQG